MFSKNLTEKATEFMLLCLVTLMYVALCAEADMYVPAFPEMVEYFSTTEDKIHLILSINFAGLCLASLICGPLSDVYGRRKVLLFGLLFFSFSSIACVFADSLNSMLFWRFIQGLSASVPMVVGCAIFLDKFALGKASQLIGIMNSVITAAMAAAPIVGAFIALHFDWKLNFVIIAILASASFLGTYFFIEESLPIEKRNPLNIPSILKNYVSLLFDFRFVGYTLITMLPFIGVLVYVANLSLIFINHLDVPAENFGYYQATTMGVFVIFSYWSSKLIASKGMDYTKNLGAFLTILGGAGLFLTAFLAPTSVGLICTAMGFFAAGGALMVGIFGMKTLDLHPDMKGAASSLLTAIRQLLASGLVLVSEFTFDGTIVPVAMIIFTYVMVAVLWYAAIKVLDSKRLKAQSQA